MKGNWSFQITRKGGQNSVGEVRTIAVSRSNPNRPGYNSSNKPSYYVISGTTHGTTGYNIVADDGTGVGKTFYSESEAMRYFQSELKKHNADDWEYEKKPDEKSSFSELADKTMKSKKESPKKSTKPVVKEISTSSSSRGAGSTKTSGS